MFIERQSVRNVHCSPRGGGWGYFEGTIGKLELFSKPNIVNALKIDHWGISEILFDITIYLGT